jgi:cysteine desulfurase / selenocysteine lyase
VSARRSALDALREFYETSYTNVHRGVYLLAERATERFEGSREKVRAFINAASTREIIFTRSATEGLYLAAYAWASPVSATSSLRPSSSTTRTSSPGSRSRSTPRAAFRPIPGRRSWRAAARRARRDREAGPRQVVANNLVSNALGTINRVEKLAARAHEQGAIMVVDAAQATPHRRIDVQALGCDPLAFSSHKLCGPTGVGVLWGRAELLERMSPFNFGAEMIREVTVGKTRWNELPYKFEAGTPPIGGGRDGRRDRLPDRDRHGGNRGARARPRRLRARAPGRRSGGARLRAAGERRHKVKKTFGNGPSPTRGPSDGGVRR